MKYVFSLVFVLKIYVLICQNVGIGTTTPTANLDVNGSFKLTNGTQGANKVLTSDNNGNATWQAPASLPGSSGQFGSWNPCNNPSLSEYQPVYADDAEYGGFGYDVDIDGDFAVIGAPYADFGGVPEKGVAYIYHFNGSQWELMQTLFDINGEFEDRFGFSVSISGFTIVIGAPKSNTADVADEGGAFVYLYNGSSWDLTQILRGTDAMEGDRFGCAVDVFQTSIIVGARYDRTVDGVDSVGSVSVFTYNTLVNTYFFTTKFFRPGLSPNSNFGFSLSIHNNRFVVGANEDYDGEGAIYTYKKTGSVWMYDAELYDVNIVLPYSSFGHSVAIFNDEIVAGLPYRTSETAVESCGGIVFYKNDGVSWDFSGFKYPQQIMINANYGIDVNLDNNYLMVGSNISDNPPDSQEGEVSIFQRIGIGWNNIENVNDPAAEPFDRMNQSAIDGITKRFVVCSGDNGFGSGKCIFGKINN